VRPPSSPSATSRRNSDHGVSPGGTPGSPWSSDGCALSCQPAGDAAGVPAAVGARWRPVLQREGGTTWTSKPCSSPCTCWSRIGEDNRSRARRGPGRPVSLSDAELLTLAILSQWPRWRSERDFCRFADAHLRPYFPNLLSQSQLNRRIRAVEPELKVLQRDLASRVLSDGSEVYHVLDTTLIPAVVRVRACRKGLFAGQASFGRNVSKTEWVYGFKVALSVTPDGVVTSFGLASSQL
jgi:hypothetical protein